MDSAVHRPSGGDGCRIGDKPSDGGLGLVDGVNVEIGIHDVAVELDRAAVLDGEVAAGDSKRGEVEQAVHYVVSSSETEHISKLTEIHIDVAGSAGGQHVPAGFVYLYEGLQSGMRSYVGMDGEITGLLVLVVDALHHFFIRIDMEIPGVLRKGQQVGNLDRLAGIERKVELSVFRSGGLYVKPYRIERTGDVDSSGTVGIAVERRIPAFFYVDDLHVAEGDMGIEIRGREILFPAETSAERSSGVVEIPDGYRVERQHVVLYGQRTSDYVRNSGERNLEKGVFQPQIVACQPYVVQFSGESDFSGRGSSDIAEYALEERFQICQVKAVKICRTFQGLVCYAERTGRIKSPDTINVVACEEAETVDAVVPDAAQLERAYRRSGDCRRVYGQVEMETEPVLDRGVETGPAGGGSGEVHVGADDTVEQGNVESLHLQTEYVGLIPGVSSVE